MTDSVGGNGWGECEPVFTNHPLYAPHTGTQLGGTDFPFRPDGTGPLLGRPGADNRGDRPAHDRGRRELEDGGSVMQRITREQARKYAFDWRLTVRACLPAS